MRTILLAAALAAATPALAHPAPDAHSREHASLRQQLDRIERKVDGLKAEVAQHRKHQEH